MSSQLRIRRLKQKLAETSGRLRSLEGRHLNRRRPSPAPAAAPSDTPKALLELLARDLDPPHRHALLAREEQLRHQALAYFQTSKVDPKLWKDLASS